MRSTFVLLSSLLLLTTLGCTRRGRTPIPAEMDAGTPRMDARVVGPDATSPDSRIPPIDSRVPLDTSTPIDTSVPIDSFVPPDTFVPPTCTPTGDYVEASDATNDLFEMGTTEEATGLTFSPATGPTRTIGGCIDPTFATADNADADFYALDVTAPGFLRVTLSAPGAGAGDLFIGVFSAATGTPIGAREGTGTLLIPGANARAADTYLIGVAQDLPGAATPVPYTVTIETYPYSCSVAAPPADFTEAGDGATSRGNDVVTWTLPALPGDPSVIDLTAAADSPESTGITLVAGLDRLFSGSSGDVTALDSYLDRDTYQVTTGASTTELHLLLSWPDAADVDLDFAVFRANDVMDGSIGGAFQIGTVDDEEAVIAVDPSTTYWIWVAAFDDTALLPTLPASYDITVCAN